MAKAITHIEKRVPNAVEEQEQAIQEILTAAATNKEALLILIDVVNHLHQAGLLEMAQGFLTNRHKIGVIGLNQLNKSGAQRIIKNGMGAVQFLSRLDPAKLETLLGAVATGVDEASEAKEEHKQLGMMDLFKSMRDPEVQTSLGVMMNFLRGMGKGLRA